MLIRGINKTSIEHSHMGQKRELSFAKIRSDENKATESSTIGKHAITGYGFGKNLVAFLKKLTKSGSIWMYPMIIGIEMKGNVG